jgi:hypothetical protein
MPVNQIEPCESVLPAAETFEAGLRSEIAPVGVAAQPSGAGKRISIGMLLLGAGLVWPVPIGGVLFLVSGAFGLAISSEAELTQQTPSDA